MQFLIKLFDKIINMDEYSCQLTTWTPNRKVQNLSLPLLVVKEQILFRLLLDKKARTLSSAATYKTKLNANWKKDHPFITSVN
jgi:hypothetical protein